MSLFRELVDAVREQVEAARPPAGPPVRPTSLREAGAVGEATERTRRRVPREDTSPEGAVPDDQAPRPRPRPLQDVGRAPARTQARAGLMTALRSPASLRTAILVREVLDPPLALREERQAARPARERGMRTG